jgi:hypothetical protein
MIYMSSLEKFVSRDILTRREADNHEEHESVGMSRESCDGPASGRAGERASERDSDVSDSGHGNSAFRRALATAK